MTSTSVIIRKPKTGHKSSDKERKIYGVYTRSILNTKVTLSILDIGKNIKQILEHRIVTSIAGKCIVQGFIKPNSIKVLRYSCGDIVSDFVQFQVVYECMICMPVEGMLVESVCKTVTKAGIHAEVIDSDKNVPLTVFVARDHHHMDDRMTKIKEGDMITVRIIGIRFELNDAYICAIAKLTNIGLEDDKPKKPRLNLGGTLSESDSNIGGENIRIEFDDDEDDDDN
jgi:DNA-directed RNA polymerase subunit E'/Rpb7